MVGRRKELSVDTREAIISLYYSGIRQAEISRRLNIPRTTITSVVDRFRKRGSLQNKPRKGAPSKLDGRDIRTLLRLVKNNRGKSLSEITAIFNENRPSIVSKRTIQRILYCNNFHRRIVKKRIQIREVNRKNRVNWCRSNRLKTVANFWKRVIFSDECKVDFGSDNRLFIWRKSGEEWLPCCLAPPPVPKFSLMIWACITYDGVGTLTVVEGNVNAQGYINILDNNLWPVVVRHFPAGDFIFQDDNAPIHRAATVTRFKQQNQIRSLLWPAQSPDLNIIENCWYRLKRQLKNRRDIIRSKDQLALAIRDIWLNTPVDYIRNLYSSIPRRIRNVITSKGYITKY